MTQQSWVTANGCQRVPTSSGALGETWLTTEANDDWASQVLPPLIQVRKALFSETEGKLVLLTVIKTCRGQQHKCERYHEKKKTRTPLGFQRQRSQCILLWFSVSQNLVKTKKALEKKKASSL